jgi:prepilin-type N-terminal cleavage/methylation domain-containing protein
MKPGWDNSISRSLPGMRRHRAAIHDKTGFTLLEVLISLVVLAVAASVTMSVISGSLGNVRKAQIRTSMMDYAQTQIESALYNEDMQQPGEYSDVLDNGYTCTIRVEEYYPEEEDPEQSGLTVKLLQYTVEMVDPESLQPVYALHTLKLVNSAEEVQSSTTQ